MRLKTDEVLFVAGDPGDGCYRVLDGLLKVVMTSDSNERILAFLGLGAIVGELSVIDRLPRSASVTAVRPAILSFVSDADFREFGKEHPQVYPPWAQIVFVGYMSRDQIHQVIAREREMLAAIEKSRPQLQLSNSRFAEQRNEIIKELEAELAYRDQNGID